tara:strand:- start:18 stop:878 length:861 start_codon:yes stop_codon:yes gene_type:complete
MIKSMTGFGRGEFIDASCKITTEIRSVNSRFLEIKFRGHGIDLETERNIRIMFEKLLYRGNVSIRIEVQNLIESNDVIFDKERFELAQNILKEIHVSYGQKINLSDIISFQDLLKSDYSKKMNNENIISSVSAALNQLDEMRVQEGLNIHTDLTNRVNALKLSISIAEKISSEYSSEKQKSLRGKILDLLGNEKIDESRLIQEVAYLTDRSDITEEIIRCQSHFEQLDIYLGKDEPSGKRINFLIQEISREVNTIGSKSPQTEVTKNIVEMKNELEKIREQIQNVL